MKYILFVCVENSARSQMAEGLFNFYNNNTEYMAISAGTKPVASIKAQAIEAMLERGIDISRQEPKALDDDMIQNSFLIFTMGCIDECPALPSEKTVDWTIEDPGDQNVEKFKQVRGEIEHLVTKLISELK